jgi:hypothetical protein
MDKLEFRKKNHIFDWGCETVLAEIVINGKPFSEIAEHYERLIAEKSGAEYDGLGYLYNYADVMYEELINKKSDVSNKEPALMICSCGEEGCGAILVTVDETETGIIWHSFRNHQAKNWDYSIFPTFRFEKNAYQAALDYVKNIILTG